MKGAPYFLDGKMGRRRSTILPKAAVARIIANAGAERVSDGAAKELVDILEERGRRITESAVQAAQHAGRKTVQAEDIRLAVKNTAKAF